MRTIRLHDTYSGELKELRPRDGRKVGIYACGPTVYGRIHVGNARPFVVFTLLKRFLEHEGLQTTLQNWQSEFLAVGSMAVLAVYLRQRGSPESKPVGAPHHATSVEG